VWIFYNLAQLQINQIGSMLIERQSRNEKQQLFRYNRNESLPLVLMFGTTQEKTAMLMATLKMRSIITA
jgi:hypothetical protein